MLSATGIPLMTAESAAPMQPESMEPAEIDEAAAEATDEAAGESIPLLATWMQWMRPLDVVAPKSLGQVGSGGPALADPALPAQAKVLNTTALVLGALPQTKAAVEPQIQTDTEGPAEALAEPGVPETPIASSPATFAAMLKAVDTGTALPVVMPDAAPSAPLTPQLPQLSSSAPHPQAPVAPPPGLINTQHAEWTRQLGERIAWSVDEQQDAVIELHPAELGSLSVRVEMRGNDAQVTIIAASSAARDMLQQSLPQLRELLLVQGLNLSRAQVERPSQANGSGQSQAENGSRERGGGRGRRQVSSLLLVDAYA